MKITAVVSGKNSGTLLNPGVEEYIRRLRFYCPFEWKFTAALKSRRNIPEAMQKEKEGDAFISEIAGKNDVYLLDERGKEYTSAGLAAFLEKKMMAGCKELVFVIGGPYGFSKPVEELSTGKISLSKLTFPHQMVRLLLAEQLYRAFTIIRGEPYHHD